MVEIVLTGTLNLNRIVFDQSQAARELSSQAGVFAVSFDTSRLNIKSGMALGASNSVDQIPRDELEKNSILQLVCSKLPPWGLPDEHQSFACLFYDLKESVRNSKCPEELANLITTSPLVDKVKVALSIPAKSINQMPEATVDILQEAL